MTPLLPTPNDYLYNLIAMTSPEAKRLWRRSIKEHFDHTCIYCGKTYDLVSYLSIMFILAHVAERMSQRMLYAPVPDVIRIKEVHPSLVG